MDAVDRDPNGWRRNLSPKELIVEIAGIMAAGLNPLISPDEVRGFMERAENFEDAKRFLWALRCRAAVIRVGTRERFELEDRLERCRQLIRQQAKG